jgi:hypothetical protein
VGVFYFNFFLFSDLLRARTVGFLVRWRYWFKSTYLGNLRWCLLHFLHWKSILHSSIPSLHLTGHNLGCSSQTGFWPDHFRIPNWFWHLVRLCLVGLAGKACGGSVCHLRIARSFGRFSCPLFHCCFGCFSEFLGDSTDIFVREFCITISLCFEFRFQPFWRLQLSTFCRRFGNVSWILDEAPSSKSKEFSHHLRHTKHCNPFWWCLAFLIFIFLEV